jgi:hypothetical protein
MDAGATDRAGMEEQQKPCAGFHLAAWIIF